MIVLFIKNLGIALARMPKAVLGFYQAVPGDSYIKNVLVTLDQLGNTILLGDPDETISSRSAKLQAQGEWVGCVMCKFLSWFQKDHCGLALERDKGRRAIIPD